MINPEQSTLRYEEIDTANFIISQSTELDSRVYQRVLLEAANIPIKNVPIGGKENEDQLFAFMDLASQGFALSLRAQRSTKQEYPLLANAVEGLGPKPLDAIWREIESLGIPVSEQIESPNDQQLLASAGHFVATIAALSSEGTVTYSSLGLKKRAPDQPTYWRRKWPIVDVLKLFSEIKSTTRQMIEEQRPIPDMYKAYEAAHFHAVSSLLAQDLLKKFL